MLCMEIMLVSSRNAMRASYSTDCSVRSSASVRLPLVFSASTPSRSMVCLRPGCRSRPLAFLPGAHLDHGRHIELVHQVVERDRGLRADTRVLRANKFFQALRRSVVRALLFADFPRRWAPGAIPARPQDPLRDRSPATSIARWPSVTSCGPGTRFFFRRLRLRLGLPGWRSGLA